MEHNHNGQVGHRRSTGGIGSFRETIEIERFPPDVATTSTGGAPIPGRGETFFLTVYGPRRGTKLLRSVTREQLEGLRGAIGTILAHEQEPCCPEGTGECSEEPGHVTPSEGHCPNCCPEGCTDCAGA